MTSPSAPSSKVWWATSKASMYMDQRRPIPLVRSTPICPIVFAENARFQFSGTNFHIPSHFSSSARTRPRVNGQLSSPTSFLSSAPPNRPRLLNPHSIAISSCYFSTLCSRSRARSRTRCSNPPEHSIRPARRVMRVSETRYENETQPRSTRPS